MKSVYKVVVTRYEGPDHKSRSAASIALRLLKLRKSELAVVIEVPATAPARSGTRAPAARKKSR